MVQPQWNRYSREQARKVLQDLSGHGDAVVFSPDVTDVSWRSLPFYSNYRLYRLINYATMPTFTRYYLGDGAEYFSIDGTSAPIYTVNEKDPIHLTQENVVSYLEFFFNNVHGSEGEVFLIRDITKMPFMKTLTPEQRQNVVGSFRPLLAAPEAGAGTFRVTGTLHYGGGLILAAMLVTSDGKISFAEQNLLLSGVHFPDSPYSESWMEG